MRGLRVIPIIAFAALAWFLFVSEQGSRWFAGVVTTKAHSGLPTGKISSFQGTFKRIHAGGVDAFDKNAKPPITVFDGDRIEVDAGSSVVLILNSQDELELGALTAVSLELWNSRDAASPVYVGWQLGQVQTRTKGVKGKAYLVRDGRLYFPGQSPSNKPLALTVLRAAPIDMQLADAGHDELEVDAEPVALPAESEAPAQGAEPETLSNEYIDEMIAGRQAQLQRCWLSRLKENPDLKGQVMLQFEITRRGRVRDLRVVDATIQDEALHRCVISVVERIVFRSYKGQDISISYPINFE